MKSKFSEFFPISSNDSENHWKNALIVLDTNVLLNFYRYSDSTRDEYIKVLKKLNTRIWLPNRVVYEFLNNRLNIIHEQEQSYIDTVELIERLESKIKSSREHPFVSKSTLDSTFDLFNKLKNELNENQKNHTCRINNDLILEELASIFDDSVGEGYDDEIIEKIIAEGEERYSLGIPPGFGDRRKKAENNSLMERAKKYGDLIIWKQIIDKSKADDLDIIFVTDDGKEDWWHKFKGKTLGPRIELKKEFNDYTARTLIMCKPYRFLEKSSQITNEGVTTQAVDEVKETKINITDFAKEAALVSSQLLTQNLLNYWIENDKVKSETLGELYKRERSATHSIFKTNKEIKELSFKLNSSDISNEDKDKISSKLVKLESLLKFKRFNLKRIKEQIINLRSEDDDSSILELIEEQGDLTPE